MSKSEYETAGVSNPFWTIDITFESENDRDRVLPEIEKLLHSMGQIGLIASQKWEMLL